MTTASLPPSDRISVEPEPAQLAGLGALDPGAPVVMLN